MHASDESKFNGESRIVTSLPVGHRQLGMHANSSEAFFKLDEELNQDYLPKTRYTGPIEEDLGDDVDLMNIGFDSDIDENVEFRPRNFTVGSPTDLPQTREPKGVSIEKSSPKPNVAASIPIDIASSNRSLFNVDGEEEVIPINKLETKLKGANPEEIAEAFSLREQTMFRNMQLMSLSVQPDDCPERLFGLGTPHDPIPNRIGASTYAPGAIHIPQQHTPSLQNSPASVKMPRQTPKVMRPASQQPTMHVKGDRLPTQHRM